MGEDPIAKDTRWPDNLLPTSSESITIAAGRVLDVPKATPTFALWTGTSPGDNFGGKPILDFKGRPAFAELAILWNFLEAGWDGVWVDSYRRRYLRAFWPTPVSVHLPPDREELLRRVRAGAGEKARPWDVFCWSGENVVFSEAKRLKRDSIRSSQIDFLTAAIDIGLPVSSFLLVEWSA